MERAYQNNVHYAGIPNGVVMPHTTIDQLNVLLAELTARVDCIRGIVISSADGLKIADRFRDHSYDISIAHAISASIVGLANKSVLNLSLPPSDRIVIYTGEGIVAVFNLGNASLLALLDPDANVGLVMIELQHTAEKVKKVMRL
ncbi:MAG: roadblock/LC7 domain-containing protein [Euryarchaeota archaeon]|nr:roadblock/LC7 domain-containing protein [Euryarchaeota archaeon]